MTRLDCIVNRHVAIEMLEAASVKLCAWLILSSRLSNNIAAVDTILLAWYQSLEQAYIMDSCLHSTKHATAMGGLRYIVRLYTTWHVSTNSLCCTQSAFSCVEKVWQVFRASHSFPSQLVPLRPKGCSHCPAWASTSTLCTRRKLLRHSRQKYFVLSRDVSLTNGQELFK